MYLNVCSKAENLREQTVLKHILAVQIFGKSFDSKKNTDASLLSLSLDGLSSKHLQLLIDLPLLDITDSRLKVS
jgi:hypothetical protein